MRSLLRKHRNGIAHCAIAAVGLFGAFASAVGQTPNYQVIVSGLPERGAASYEALYEVAARPSREVLEMTKSEVWTIPTERWDQVFAAAEKAGVKLTRLDANWNHPLAAMPTTAPMSSHQKAMMQDAMASKAAAGISMMALRDPSIEEYALTKNMRAATPNEPQPVLVLALKDGMSVTARRTGIVPISGGYAWHGLIEETGEPVTLLWWPSGKMTGTVTYKNRIYSVRDFGGGMLAVIETVPDKLPDEHAPMDAGMREKMHLKQDPLIKGGDAGALMDSMGTLRAPADDPIHPDRSEIKKLQDAAPEKLALAVPAPYQFTIKPPATLSAPEPATIRVIVAYTKAAASRYTDIETDLIPLAIEDANQSFRSSGISNVTLELAYAYQTDYVESGTHFEHVFRFADKGDGYLEEVHALRDRYKADVGLLIVHDPNGCGLAAEVYARPERAFAVVHHECAANMYSLGHEIGHLIGARHDEALDDTKQPFAYGHGFVFGKSWRTMMSYKDSCDGCPRIPIWSNPNVLVNGVPAGDSDSNNARVIAEEAARVAKFR